MAIHQRQREDLLREASAYPRRLSIQLQMNGAECELFAGIRPGSGWSYYFDESPVMQFNSAGELRRLFIDNRKLLAQAGNLYELKRDTSTNARLVHHAQRLAEDFERQVLRCCRDRLAEANRAISLGLYHLQGQLPLADESIITDFKQQLAAAVAGFCVAQSANAHVSHA